MKNENIDTGMQNEEVEKPDEHNKCGDEGESKFTEVKNANAAGLGAMGRTEKKVPDGKEESNENDKIVY